MKAVSKLLILYDKLIIPFLTYNKKNLLGVMELFFWIHQQTIWFFNYQFQQSIQPVSVTVHYSGCHTWQKKLFLAHLQIIYKTPAYSHSLDLCFWKAISLDHISCCFLYPVIFSWEETLYEILLIAQLIVHTPKFSLGMCFEINMPLWTVLNVMLTSCSQIFLLSSH